MLRYTATDAKAKFSEIMALAMAGEEIIVTKMGKPVVKIDKLHDTKKRKKLLGLFKGQMKVPDDFNDWPRDMAHALGMVE